MEGKLKSTANCCAKYLLSLAAGEFFAQLFL